MSNSGLAAYDGEAESYPALRFVAVACAEDGGCSDCTCTPNPSI